MMTRLIFVAVLLSTATLANIDVEAPASRLWSYVDADGVSNLVSENRSFKVQRIQRGTPGVDIEAMDIIVLEEKTRKYHPAVGWCPTHLKLTAYKQAFGEIEQILWSVEIVGNVKGAGLDWKIENESLKITEWLDTDGSLKKISHYDSFSGKLIEIEEVDPY